MFALLLATAAIPPAAQAQLAQVQAAVERYRDFEAAKADGWKPFGGDEPLMGQHWFHPRGPDYQSADARIDFARPSNLMYTDIGGQKVLTGVSFNVRLGPGERLPAGFAGIADRWHVHDFERAIAAATETRPLLRWLAQSWIDANYRNKGDDRGRVAMVHAWVTLPNPDGVFADHNRTLPYLKLGLPVGWAANASIDAARGLHLATAKGCADTVGGAIWIADTGRAKARALRRACADAAAHVRLGLASREPRQVNAMAEHGWAMFTSARDQILTSAQKARIAALTEHGADAAAHAHHH